MSTAPTPFVPRALPNEPAPQLFVVLQLKVRGTDGHFEILRMPYDKILDIIQSVNDCADERDEGARIHHFLAWCGMAWTCSHGILEHDDDDYIRFARMYTFTPACAQNSEVFPLLYLGNARGELWTSYFSRKGLSWPQVDVKDILARAMLELASPHREASLRRPLRDALHRRDDGTCGFTCHPTRSIYHILTHRMGDAFIVSKALQAHALTVASGGDWRGPDPLHWSIDDPLNAFVALGPDNGPDWGIFPSPTRLFSRECIAYKRIGLGTDRWWQQCTTDLRYTLHRFVEQTHTIHVAFGDTVIHLETGVDFILRETVEDDMVSRDADLDYPPAWIVEAGYVARLFCSFMGDDLARLVNDMRNAWDQHRKQVDGDEDDDDVDETYLRNLEAVFMLMPRPSIPPDFDWHDRSGFDFVPRDTNAASFNAYCEGDDDLAM